MPVKKNNPGKQTAKAKRAALAFANEVETQLEVYDAEAAAAANARLKEAQQKQREEDLILKDDDADYSAKCAIKTFRVAAHDAMKGWASDKPTSILSKTFDLKEFKDAMKSGSDYDCRCVLADFDASRNSNPNVSPNDIAITELRDYHFANKGIGPPPKRCPFEFVVLVPDAQWDPSKHRGAWLLLSAVEEVQVYHAILYDLMQKKPELLQSWRKHVSALTVTFRLVKSSEQTSSAFLFREDKFATAKFTVYTPRQRTEFVLGEQTKISGAKTASQAQVLKHLKATVPRVSPGKDEWTAGTIENVMKASKVYKHKPSNAAIRKFELLGAGNPMDSIYKVATCRVRGKTDEGTCWFIELLFDHWGSCRISSSLPQDFIAGGHGQLIMFEQGVQEFLLNRWVPQKFPELPEAATNALRNNLKSVKHCRANVVQQDRTEEVADRQWITIHGQPYPKTVGLLVDFCADLVFGDQYAGSLKVAIKNNRGPNDIFEYQLIKDGTDLVIEAYASEQKRI